MSLYLFLKKTEVTSLNITLLFSIFTKVIIDLLLNNLNLSLLKFSIVPRGTI